MFQEEVTENDTNSMSHGSLVLICSTRQSSEKLCLETGGLEAAVNPQLKACRFSIRTEKRSTDTRFLSLSLSVSLSAWIFQTREIIPAQNYSSSRLSFVYSRYEHTRVTRYSVISVRTLARVCQPNN